MTKAEYLHQLSVYHKKGPIVYFWANLVGAFGILLILFVLFYYEFLAKELSVIMRNAIGISMIVLAATSVLIFFLFITKQVEFEIILKAYKPKPAIKSFAQINYDLLLRLKDTSFRIEPSNNLVPGIAWEATEKKRLFYQTNTRIMVLNVPSITVENIHQFLTRLTFDLSADKYLAIYILIVADETEEAVRDYLEYEISTKQQRYHLTLFDLSLGRYYFKLPYSLSSDENDTTHFIHLSRFLYKYIIGEKQRSLEKQTKEERNSRKTTRRGMTP